MRTIILCALAISLPFCALPKEQPVGKAANEGKSNASTIAWAVFGAAFLVTIGVVVAVAISQSNNNKVVVVQN